MDSFVRVTRDAIYTQHIAHVGSQNGMDSTPAMIFLIHGYRNQ